MTAGLRLFSFPEAEFAIVEIVGRPGSGKSYLCQSLLGCSGWQMEPGAGEAGRRWLAPLACMLRPIVSLLALAAASTRSPMDLHRFRQVVRLVRKHDGLRRLKHRGATLVEEGPVHALLNVFFWSSATPASRLFTRSLVRALSRLPATFIYLDIAPQASLENTKRRDQPGSWFNREMSDEIAERYVADSAYDEIVQTLKSVAPEKVRCFSSVEEARNFLMQWPEPRAAAAAKDARSITAVRPC